MRNYEEYLELRERLIKEGLSYPEATERASKAKNKK